SPGPGALCLRAKRPGAPVLGAGAVAGSRPLGGARRALPRIPAARDGRVRPRPVRRCGGPVGACRRAEPLRHPRPELPGTCANSDREDARIDGHRKMTARVRPPSDTTPRADDLAMSAVIPSNDTTPESDPAPGEARAESGRVGMPIRWIVSIGTICLTTLV